MADSSPLAAQIAFLELVRDEVHYAAEAKRQQLTQGYSNDTLATMVRGIKWSEARDRISALSSFPADAVEQVARVLRRELSVGTVERIDDLLTPAVFGLRDAWEDRDAIQTAGDGLPDDIKTAGENRQPAGSNEAASPTKTKPPAPIPKLKAKRSTERGEARAKLIATRSQHHQYADGSCLNPEPIGCNALARLSGVAGSTVSAFFRQDFQGHKKYQQLCNDTGRLVAALMALNGEFRPRDFYSARTPDEVEQDRHNDE